MQPHFASIRILTTGEVPQPQTAAEAAALREQIAAASEQLLDAIAKIEQSAALLDVAPTLIADSPAAETVCSGILQAVDADPTIPIDPVGPERGVHTRFFPRSHSRLAMVFMATMTWLDENPDAKVGRRLYREIQATFRELGPRIDFSVPFGYSVRSGLLHRDDTGNVTATELGREVFDAMKAAQWAFVHRIKQATELRIFTPEPDVDVTKYFKHGRIRRAMVFMACMSWLEGPPPRAIHRRIFGEIHGAYEGLGARIDFSQPMGFYVQSGLWTRGDDDVFTPTDLGRRVFAKMKATDFTTLTTKENTSSPTLPFRPVAPSAA